ncbi:MAG: SGNH/GDSL hydrolase family protein [Acidobacteriota bacterium]
MSSPQRSRLVWWTRFLLVQLVAVLVLLEVALRVYNPVVVRVRGNEIVLPVKQVYRFDNGPTTKIDRFTVHTKNVLGFRGPDPPADFADRMTLVTIGGSTTESLFLSDGRTWTDALARRLEPVSPGIWINNAGIDGQTTFGHLTLMQSFIVRLRPRIAVFLIGANDVCLDQPNTFDAGILPTGGRARALANDVAARSEVVSLAWNLVRARRARNRGLGHSELDLTRASELVLPDDVMARTEAQCASTIPAFAARLEALAGLARTQGITPVWVTQPALFGDAVDPATGVALGHVQVSGRGNGRLEWRLLESVNEATRRVASAQQVALVDLARTLPKDSRLFYDFLHFTNEGSERVGEIVARHLIDYGLFR